MQKDDIQRQLQILEGHVAALTDALRISREALRKADEDKRDLRLLVEKQKETLKHFQNQSKINTIVGTLVAQATDGNALKAKIEQYLTEIDHTIRLLKE